MKFLLSCVLFALMQLVACAPVSSSTSISFWLGNHAQPTPPPAVVSTTTSTSFWLGNHALSTHPPAVMPTSSTTSIWLGNEVTPPASSTISIWFGNEEAQAPIQTIAAVSHIHLPQILPNDGPPLGNSSSRHLPQISPEDGFPPINSSFSHLSPRSFWSDNFGELHADHFSITLYSSFAFPYTQLHSNDSRNLCVNISTVMGHESLTPRCSDTDGFYQGWVYGAKKQAMQHKLGLSGTVGVQPNDMCRSSDGQGSYNQTQISYMNSTITPWLSPAACQEWTQPGGQWIVSSNATGFGVLRCVFELAGVRLTEGITGFQESFE